jgi:hypothetical protein
VRLDHLLSKEYMSLDRACTIATAYKSLKSTTDSFVLLSRMTKEQLRAKESIDQLDRRAGGSKHRVSPALFSLEGTNVVSSQILENCIEKNFHVSRE